MVGGISAVEVKSRGAIVGAKLSSRVSVSVVADTNALSSRSISERKASSLVASSNASIATADIRIQSWRAGENASVEKRIAEIQSVAAVHTPKGDIVGVCSIRAGKLASLGGVEFEHAAGAGVIGPNAHIGHVIGKGPYLCIEEGKVASEIGVAVGDVDDVALERSSHADQSQVVAPTSARTHLYALPSA